MNTTAEQIAAALHRELRGQAGQTSGYVEEEQGADGLTSIDGHFDLVAVATAILAGLK